MIFMQPSRYPIHPYTKYMKPKRMHIFTFIQAALFALLYTVKSIKTIAIAFPLFIAACIPIRIFLLPKIFSEEELILIDSDEATVKAWLSHHPHEEKDGGDSSGSDRFSEHKRDDHDIEMQKPPLSLAGEAGEENTEAQKTTKLPPPTKPVRSRPRRDRRRSVSCPAPNMLFAEGPPAPLEPLTISPNILFADAAVPRVYFEIPEVDEEEKEVEPLDATDAAGRHAHGQESSFVNEAPKVDTGATSSLSRGESFAEAGTASKPRRRQRRKKTVSCPAHTLFHEADRHVASNYFFG